MSEEINALIPEELQIHKQAAFIQDLVTSYLEVAQLPTSKTLIEQLIHAICQQIKTPFIFPNYHEKTTHPFNYEKFGKDFIRPLIVQEKSTITGKEHFTQLEHLIKKGDNAILLYNHQTEPDPQIFTVMLEKRWPKLTDSFIFVAGHRVTEDPVAVPFSLGCNLLCVYSKKHLEHPKEEKEAKVQHNRKTTATMLNLLNEGGKCILVAPSGGRDRKDVDGTLVPALFDPQSIEMLYLTSQRAKKRTYFYPLSLFSYDLLPPPGPRHHELGEKRIVNRTPIHITLGDQLHFDQLCDPGLDKREARKKRSSMIYNIILDNYRKFPL